MTVCVAASETSGSIVTGNWWLRPMCVLCGYCVCVCVAWPGIPEWPQPCVTSIVWKLCHDIGDPITVKSSIIVWHCVWYCVAGCGLLTLCVCPGYCVTNCYCVLCVNDNYCYWPWYWLLLTVLSQYYYWASVTIEPIIGPNYWLLTCYSCYCGSWPDYYWFIGSDYYW